MTKQELKSLIKETFLETKILKEEGDWVEVPFEILPKEIKSDFSILGLNSKNFIIKRNEKNNEYVVNVNYITVSDIKQTKYLYDISGTDNKKVQLIFKLKK